MTDTQHRLIRCFRAVFPDLRSDADAVDASVSSMAAWDSLAMVILAAAVEEEFGIQVEPQDIERLHSFESYLNWLKADSRIAASAPEQIVT